MTNERIIKEINLMLENQLPNLNLFDKLVLTFEDFFLDIIMDMQ